MSGRRNSLPSPSASGGQSAVPSSRIRSFRLATALLIPLLLLLALEGSLRIAGVGYPTSFFLQREIAGRSVLVDNPDFGRLFFPRGLVRYPKPMAVPAAKSKNALRVVVLGESAAMGDPEPRLGLPRMLEVLLRDRFPGREIEVVNGAMVAINSHVLLPIAREMAAREADAWVIYMGNNEMIGPYGCLSQFGARAPSRWLIRAGLAVKQTRLGQIGDQLICYVRQRNRPAAEWSGMSLWQDQRITPGDDAVERVYQNFEANLRGMLEAGQRAGIPIILCTVATNLRDCAPFASVHRAGLSQADLARWQAAYDQGLALERSGDLGGASAAFEQALSIEAQFADLWYRSACCALELGDAAKAQLGFREARDRDALPFRADTRINTIVRRVASDAPGAVTLVDVERLAAKSAPDELPGGQMFFEHVHFTPAGNYWLASTLAGEVSRALKLMSAESATDRSSGVGSAADLGKWQSEDACLQAVGLTPWKRHQVLSRMLDRIQEPPFTTQLNHDEQVRHFRLELDRSRGAAKPVQMQRAARQLAAVVAAWPDDADLHWNLAELLDTLDDAGPAEAEWRAVIRLLPHAHLPYFNLGRLLQTHGRSREAVDLYQQCLKLNPDFREARAALSAVRSSQ